MEAPAWIMGPLQAPFPAGTDAQCGITEDILGDIPPVPSLPCHSPLSSLGSRSSPASKAQHIPRMELPHLGDLSLVQEIVQVRGTAWEGHGLPQHDLPHCSLGLVLHQRQSSSMAPMVTWLHHLPVTTLA